MKEVVEHVQKTSSDSSWLVQRCEVGKLGEMRQVHKQMVYQALLRLGFFLRAMDTHLEGIKQGNLYDKIYNFEWVCRECIAERLERRLVRRLLK